jgi:hypothetical protein
MRYGDTGPRSGRHSRGTKSHALTSGFPVCALTLVNNAHPAQRIRMIDANRMQPASNEAMDAIQGTWQTISNCHSGLCVGQRANRKLTGEPSTFRLADHSPRIVGSATRGRITKTRSFLKLFMNWYDGSRGAEILHPFLKHFSFSSLAQYRYLFRSTARLADRCKSI